VVQEKKMKKRVWFIMSVVALLSACAPVISKQGLRELDPEITFQKLLKDPDRYKEKVVLLGGQIVSTTVKEGETWVEVLQKPLNSQQEPEETDVSYGRFLVHFMDFRDPAIYSGERKITVLGEVQGKKVMPLKEMDYTYPVLIPRESHLWKPETSSGPFFHFGIGVGGVFR
jgi:outer membrane lipoprotein